MNASVTLDDERLTLQMLRALANISDALKHPAAAERGDAGMLNTLTEIVTGWQATAAAWLAADAAQTPNRWLTAGPEASRLVAEEHLLQSIASRAPAELALSVQPLPGATSKSLLIVPVAGAQWRGCVVAMLPAEQPATRKLVLLQGARMLARCLEATSDAASSGDTLATTSLLKLHESLDWKEACFNLVNEARVLLRCDRVTLLLRRAAKYRVQAVSGQIELNPRANHIRRLEALSAAVLAWREPFQFPTTADLPPQMERAVSDYTDESPARSFRILPLFEPAPASQTAASQSRLPFAALFIEDFRHDQLTVGEESTQQIGATAAIALHHALEFRQIIFRPLWQSLGRAVLNPEYRWVRRVAALVLVAMVCSLGLVRTTYTVAARGSLQPRVQRYLYAPLDGVVREISVKQGTTVAKGELLLKMENAQLSTRVAECDGQMRVAAEQLASVKSLRLQSQAKQDVATSDRLASEERRLSMQMTTLESQRTLLREQERSLEIRSPIDGTVISWDIERQLKGRPVERGQRLLTVADLSGAWDLELNVPDRAAARVRRQDAANRDGLPVTFVVAGEPQSNRTARLRHVADSSQPDGSRDLVLQLNAAVDDHSAMTTDQAGAEVRAKIACGRERLGYVWFHELVDFLYARVFFALPIWSDGT